MPQTGTVDPTCVEDAQNIELQPTTIIAPKSEDDLSKQTTKARPQREATLKDYFRIFTYAKVWDFPLMGAAALASVGAGVTLPLMNVVFGIFCQSKSAILSAHQLLGQLVGNFNDYFTPGTTLTQASFERSINKFALYIFILFIARFVCNYISKFAFRMIGIRMSAAIRLDYLTHLFRQTIHVLDTMHPGAASGTITTTANTLQLGISEQLGTLVQFLATSIAAIIIAFTYSWSLTLVTGSVIIFILLVVGILLPFITKGLQRVSAAESKSSAVASEAFGSIRTITACGAEPRVVEQFSVWAEAAKKYGQMTSPLMATQFGLIYFGVYAAFGLAFWYGTKSYVEARLRNVSTIVVVLLTIMLIVISIERISTPFIAVNKAMIAACEFFIVIDAPLPKQGALREPEVLATEDIVFNNVDFAYPSRPHVKVLDGLNIRIQAGKLTAIVGPSGSGKSTIVGLIERWYTLHDQYYVAKTIEKTEKVGKKSNTNERRKWWDQKDREDISHPHVEDTGPPIELRGSITTSGHKLEDFDLRWWRSKIGLVQQEPFLFNDSIYINVAYGLVGSEFESENEERKRELVRDACKESFADEFIDRLPDGYDTQVGESGAKLSGGQKQRISIARAVIRKPKILIFDEATSSIDVRGEKIVQAALDKVSRNRTSITIAHRLSTIKKADRIVVLEKGKVVEEGTHDNLVHNQGGVYSRLVHAQQLYLGDHMEDNESESPKEDIGIILEQEESTAVSELEGSRQAYHYKEQGLVGSFGRLLHEQRSRFTLYGVTLIFAMCAAASNPLQAYLFAKIIVVFQEIQDLAKFTADANFWSLMWVVLAICTGFSHFTLGFVSTHLAHYISATYRMQYFAGLLHQKISFFDEEENSTGTLVARVASDPKQLEELLGMNMATVYVSIFNLIGSLAIAFTFGWKIALVAFCVTAPLGLFAGYFRFKYELQFEKMNSAVFEESSKFAAESIGAFRTVASLTLESTICFRYSTLLSGHVSKAYRNAKWTTFVFAFSDSVSMGCQALIFWYGGRLLATHEYQPLNFFICYMAVINGAEAAGQGFSFGPNAAQSSAAANRILSVRIPEKHNIAPKKAHIADAEGGIKLEFQDVCFKYPTRSVSIFKRLNISIEKGQFAALIGASGCGKTSIISLLERFYDVNKGRILANGTNIASINIAEYRKHISLVSQEPTLFQGTLRENILLGVDPETITEEELRAACRDASIHDFIISLPEGYNTEVGSKGISFSGGQRQRIAIARALIRKPHILLLDEATSSLDSESEKVVQAALERAASGRTMVVVAHRLATVQNADIIFVLGEGKVLESGYHTELLRRKGVYWNMCQSQALDR
ncbi:P-loop containing nucleoside triphosphate hydrolase protein [Amylocarpus encephaloides]|uniref:P-loop containing nucleoside triphosphate hydrolase protein n=1 Tax=Amylocarpus encephaloides TaxID=45428 RepID=A0A9P7YBE1_9HELO|nr:P-loop containing nucleoside triphosphate hydrolase protein [Amylocarpus encephaloides]